MKPSPDSHSQYSGNCCTSKHNSHFLHKITNPESSSTWIFLLWVQIRPGLACHRPDDLLLQLEEQSCPGALNTPLPLQLHFISGSDQHLFLSRPSHIHTASCHCHRDLNNLYPSDKLSMFLDWDDTIGSSCTVSLWLQGIWTCVLRLLLWVFHLNIF